MTAGQVASFSLFLDGFGSGPGGGDAVARAVAASSSAGGGTSGEAASFASSSAGGSTSGEAASLAASFAEVSSGSRFGFGGLIIEVEEDNDSP